MNDPEGNGGGASNGDDATSPQLRGEDRFHATHERSSDRSLCGAIVDAVAAVTGNSPTELPPLHDSVDTDALERLVYGSAADRDGDRETAGVTVTFQFGGTLVKVHDEGTIVVDGVDDP